MALSPYCVIACLLLSGCATSPEVTVLTGPRYSNRADHPEWGAAIMVLQTFGKKGHMVGGYLHDSVVNKGDPFNDEFERTFDQPSIGARWGGKRW